MLERAQFRHRAALNFGATDDVAARLRDFAATGTAQNVAAAQLQTSDAPRVVFMFTGQGSQYVGMGRGLYESEPVFRAAIDRCDAIVGEQLSPRLIDVLYPRDGASSPINDTAYTQPALFAIEYALATLWQGWGVQPSALIGHSLGELVAATVAGVMTLEDALQLVVVRGALGSKALANGAMAAVMATPERVTPVLASLGNAVSIAAFNGPENTVVSGPKAACRRCQRRYSRNQGINVKPITSTSAFHTAAADAMLEPFEAAASKISYGSAQQIPIYSNLYGRRAPRRRKVIERAVLGASCARTRPVCRVGCRADGRRVHDVHRDRPAHHAARTRARVLPRERRGVAAVSASRP